VEHEAVSVRGENERDVESGSVVEALLHAVADAVRVVLGLDERQRNVGLVVEDVVGALGLAATDQFASNYDAPLRETDLFANLRHHIPSCAAQGGRDEFGADVAFGEGSFVHGGRSVSSCTGPSHVLTLLRGRGSRLGWPLPSLHAVKV
jgi:hypothetical protein